MLKAIETRYKGYRFRSRLEARWAVFFDSLGIEWEYEKEGFDLGEAGWYLPDFWLPKFSSFCEVKPKEYDFEDARKKVEALCATGGDLLLVEGLPGEKDPYICGPSSSLNWLFHDAVAGCSPWHAHAPLDCCPTMTEHLSSDDQCVPVTWGNALLCPVCGFDWVHIEGANYKASDDGSAWDGRGSAVGIEALGECGHGWTIRVGFHKGQSFMACEGAYEHQGLYIVLADSDGRALESAIEKAKQARFEHGENG